MYVQTLGANANKNFEHYQDSLSPDAIVLAASWGVNSVCEGHHYPACLYTYFLSTRVFRCLAAPDLVAAPDLARYDEMSAITVPR